MCGDTTETIQYSPKDQQFQQMVSRFLEEYAHQTGTTTVGMIMEHKENKANQTSF
jgi:3-deoxy-D-arabino-heptulosonate 7-phosphate (DAHP) synthase class II